MKKMMIIFSLFISTQLWAQKLKVFQQAVIGGSSQLTVDENGNTIKGRNRDTITYIYLETKGTPSIKELCINGDRYSFHTEKMETPVTIRKPLAMDKNARDTLIAKTTMNVYRIIPEKKLDLKKVKGHTGYTVTTSKGKASTKEAKTLDPLYRQ